MSFTQAFRELDTFDLPSIWRKSRDFHDGLHDLLDAQDRIWSFFFGVEFFGQLEKTQKKKKTWQRYVSSWWIQLKIWKNIVKLEIFLWIHDVLPT